MIQYAAAYRLYLVASEYWMPRLRGHDNFYVAARANQHLQVRLLPLSPHEIEIAAFVRLQDRVVEQMRVAAPRPFGRRGQ